MLVFPLTISGRDGEVFAEPHGFDPERPEKAPSQAFGRGMHMCLGQSLAVANVDKDSQVVHFTGKHELLYADPQIIVAMSAPPFYSGTNQDSSSSTSFGSGDTHSADRTNSVGYSVGFSFGYEESDPLGIQSASFKVSVDQSFDSSATESSSQQQFITYTTGAEDSVVFTVVPFDVYYYTIASAVDPAQVGNKLSINLPRKPQTLLASATFFDENVTGANKASPFFTHRVGDPFSYPTASRKDMLCGTKCFQSSGTIPLGQGTGYTTLQTTYDMATGHGTSYDLSVTVESEFSAGGVTAGVSAGFNYGYEVTETTTETTQFTAQIGSLDKLTPDKAYNVGLFAYKTSVAGNGNVLAVDYWVEK